MTVTRDSVVRDTQRISWNHFWRTLTGPAAAERHASEYWSEIRNRDIDPLFVLAMFWHESKFGMAGVASVTKSWGNTRPPSYGGVQSWTYSTPDNGNFSAYWRWLDGCISTVARLNDHPPYDGKNTIAEIIQTWAPPSDNNDTGRYIAVVVDFMNAHQDINLNQETPMAQLTDRVSTVWDGPNRPEIPMIDGEPQHITIHCTANYNAGADAEMHRRFVQNGGGDARASFHAVVDADESIQLLQWNEVGYHIGTGATGPGTRTSVGIEVCVNPESSFTKASAKAAKLTADLMKMYGIPIHAVRTHGSWWSPTYPSVHKNCPENYLDDTKRPYMPWATFLELVKKATENNVDEAATLKTFGEDIPYYCRGELLREGVADLREFGGKREERVCKYERLSTHRLSGQSYVWLQDLWDSMTLAGKITLY